MVEDFERCYRAVQSKDTRFDGWFFTCVTSTGIYCRPSCPAMTPRRANVRFSPTAAAAQHAGFRACMRCRPDASPGSPAWNGRADAAARALHLIADGVVDRDGVAGLASRLGYSQRQLQRLLVAEVGTGPLALARAQRAQTARLLIETTDLRLADVAFAAGFASVRQFNETVQAVFAVTPSALRRRAGRAGPPVSGGSGTLSLRLARREPFAGDALLAFLGQRAVPGIESFAEGVYRRSLRLNHGDGVVALTIDQSFVQAALRLDDLRDLTTAVSRCRRLLDLDADPVAIDEVLAHDPLLAPLVRATPGQRVAGAVDGPELAVRAIIGQQVSVAGARTVAAGLVAAIGGVLANPVPGVTRTFPTPAALVDSDPTVFSMPNARRDAVVRLARALGEGALVIDAGADPVELRAGLVALRGIGPWTADYIAMRALGDPDAFMPTDLGIRRALGRLGRPDDAASITALAERWRPWRAYAVAHLWNTHRKMEDAA